MKTGRSGTLRRILRQLGGYRLLILASILLALVTVVGNLVIPILFGNVINAFVDGGVDFSYVSVQMFFILACVVVSALSQWLMSVVNNRIVFHMVKSMREEVFEHIQSLPLKYIDSHPYGEIVSRCIADVETFADGLILGFTQLFTGMLTIIGTLVLMIYYNWIIAIVVFVLTPVSILVARRISKRSFSLFKKTSEARGEQTAYIEEMIDGMKTVQAFGRESENEKKFDEVNDKLADASLNSVFYSSLTNPSTRFVNAIIYALVALVGAVTIIYPVAAFPAAFNVGRLTTLLSYSNQYMKPFNDISEVITEFQNALASAERIYELIDEPVQSPDGDETLEDVRGVVRFDGVDFSYTEDRKLFENLSICAEAGQRIAIVGPTGCGKTTLINLLMRFYDADGGVVSVDGKDVTSLTRSSLRGSYGMVLQDTWLKHGTIRDNISFGRPDATDDEIAAAAKACHADEFIMQLDDGYETVIGEDGGVLSQGQKQLLCISRIMLCTPPMLILDEATSSIDTRTEQIIQDAFADMMKGRTSFIVAHRLSTIKNADLILVMRDGKVIEQGTHEELLEKGGFYSKLYNSQFVVWQ